MEFDGVASMCSSTVGVSSAPGRSASPPWAATLASWFFSPRRRSLNHISIVAPGESVSVISMSSEPLFASLLADIRDGWIAVGRSLLLNDVVHGGAGNLDHGGTTMRTATGGPATSGSNPAFAGATVLMVSFHPLPRPPTVRGREG